MKKLLAIAAGLIVCAFFLGGCESGLPVEAGEKALLLRAGDLEPFGYGLKQTEPFENFSKTRYLDGAKEIVYEFQTPDSEAANPLYLSTTMTFERKSSDALVAYKTESATLKAGLRIAGIKSREVENFYEYGDSSAFYILEKDGKPVGNFFSVHEGTKTYLIVMSGFYFEDAATWKKLVEEKLMKFSAYEPA